MNKWQTIEEMMPALGAEDYGEVLCRMNLAGLMYTETYKSYGDGVSHTNYFITKLGKLFCKDGPDDELWKAKAVISLLND